MAKRDVLIRLDRDTVREVDGVVEQIRQKRPKSKPSRAGAVNELVARAVRDRRYLRAIGAV